MRVRHVQWLIAAALIALGAHRASAQSGTIVVAAGGNLQAALDQAQPGQVVQLQAGATFTGNFVLPQKAGSSYITVRTSTPDAQLPGATGRIDLTHEPLLATIRSANASPALRTAAGAHHWRLIGLKFLATGGGDVITLGDAVQRDRALVPSNLVLDRIMIRGQESGQKRGIALNSASTFVRNSYIGGVRLVGQETQGIAGWNGPGPFVIENNYIEAAGIGILFGGSEPSIDQLVPSDIVIRRNHITRPVAWRSGSWAVKNLLELKNARNVQIDGNLLENNWAQSQSGFAIVFTVRAQGPQLAVVDASSTSASRTTSSGIPGRASTSSATTTTPRAGSCATWSSATTSSSTSITARWGGSGIFLQIGDEPADVHVEHNTVLQSGNIISVYGGTATAPRRVTGFRFASNIVLHNTYGIFGNNVGMGNPAIAAYFPQSVIVGNAMAGGNASLYPAGNVFPSVAALMAQFESPATGDYRLVSTSNLRSLVQGVTGVDHDEMQRALTAPVSGPRAPIGFRIAD